MSETRTKIEVSTSEPWLQQKKESPDMHSRFLLYCEYGRARTYEKVAEQLGRSHTYIQQVGRRYRWKERARAWDQEQYRLFLEELADERTKMVREQLKDVAELRTALRTAIQALDPEAMTWAELARIADTLTKIERAALGEPTHTVAVQGGAPGAPPVQLAAADPDTQQARFEEIRDRFLGALGADSLEEIDPADLDEDDLTDRQAG